MIKIKSVFVGVKLFKLKINIMKTRQSITYSQNGQDFAKLLKHCGLKEKIVLYSVKEMAVDYILKLNKKPFEIDKFKIYFEKEIKLLFVPEITVDEKTYLVDKNKYIFFFYFVENDIKKYIQICIN